MKKYFLTTDLPIGKELGVSVKIYFKKDGSDESVIQMEDAFFHSKYGKSELIPDESKFDFFKFCSLPICKKVYGLNIGKLSVMYNEYQLIHKGINAAEIFFESEENYQKFKQKLPKWVKVELPNGKNLDYELFNKAFNFNKDRSQGK